MKCLPSFLYLNHPGWFDSKLLDKFRAYRVPWNLVSFMLWNYVSISIYALYIGNGLVESVRWYGLNRLRIIEASRCINKVFLGKESSRHIIANGTSPSFPSLFSGPTNNAKIQHLSQAVIAVAKVIKSGCRWIRSISASNSNATKPWLVFASEVFQWNKSLACSNNTAYFKGSNQTEGRNSAKKSMGSLLLDLIAGFQLLLSVLSKIQKLLTLNIPVLQNQGAQAQMALPKDTTSGKISSSGILESNNNASCQRPAFSQAAMVPVNATTSGVLHVQLSLKNWMASCHRLERSHAVMTLL